MITFGNTIGMVSSQASKPEFSKIQLQMTPAEIFSKIEGSFDGAYLLESVTGPKKLAEYSYIGFNPTATVKVKDGVLEIVDHINGGKVVQKIRDPFNAVRRLVRGASESYFSRFVGGAVGYISFDAVKYWECLRTNSRDELNYPDVEFAVYDHGIIFDHRSQDMFYYHYGKNRLKQLTDIIGMNGEEEGSLRYGEPRINLNQNRFEDMVSKAKEYIASGDIFQVVLSKRFEFLLEGDSVRFYRALRKVNPSPYMYFIKVGRRRIIGSSPEMLVRVQGRRVETYPIAGTRPRVGDKDEDRRLKDELLADPKDRAEHVMLLDLARNDIGKISRFGSIRVPEYMTVHQYSHVQHIVSHVVGELMTEKDCYDALKATFPAGTVSGAPKVRAMQIIDELEATSRGPYAGAIGYFSYNGNADFAITIRTLVTDGQKGSIQVGAGIVADSDPEKEWLETEHKAEALIRALQIAEGTKD